MDCSGEALTLTVWFEWQLRDQAAECHMVGPQMETGESDLGRVTLQTDNHCTCLGCVAFWLKDGNGTKFTEEDDCCGDYKRGEAAAVGFSISGTKKPKSINPPH
ncbi:hypothetical protein INR49_004645 [Caranx melampygus]|nr:hypothetical protein INR49_004645 [Caranx melampygus]